MLANTVSLFTGLFACSFWPFSFVTILVNSSRFRIPGRPLLLTVLMVVVKRYVLLAAVLVLDRMLHVLLPVQYQVSNAKYHILLS